MQIYKEKRFWPVSEGAAGNSTLVVNAEGVWIPLGLALGATNKATYRRNGRAGSLDEADLIKTAMLRLDRIFRKRNMEARIVMLIHDALWVECPEREAEQVRHLVRKMMTTAGKLKVPLSVEME